MGRIIGTLGAIEAEAGVETRKALSALERHLQTIDDTYGRAISSVSTPSSATGGVSALDHAKLIHLDFASSGHTGFVGGSGTTNHLARWTSSTTQGDSQLYEDPAANTVYLASSLTPVANFSPSVSQEADLGAPSNIWSDIYVESIRSESLDLAFQNIRDDEGAASTKLAFGVSTHRATFSNLVAVTHDPGILLEFRDKTGAYVTSFGTGVQAADLGYTLPLTYDAGVLTHDGAGTLSWNALAYPTGANPSASVGLSAVNGSAATFMRSDGAPALSQAIVPTWSGVHTFSAQDVHNAGIDLGTSGVIKSSVANAGGAIATVFQQTTKYTGSHPFFEIDWFNGSANQPAFTIWGNAASGLTKEFRFYYDSSNYFGYTVGATGNTIFTATGTSTSLTYNATTTSFNATTTNMNSTNMGFFNVTAIARPATGGAASTYAPVGGTTIQTNDTFDGYTVGNVVKALRNLGLLT